MDKPSLSDLAMLSEPIMKLLKTVMQGIGFLFGPWQKIRQAKADAESIEVISEAIAKSDDRWGLNISYDNGIIRIESKNTEQLQETSSEEIKEYDNCFYKKAVEEVDENTNLLERSINRVLFQELSKEKNIEVVIIEAVEILYSETVVSPDPVNTAWASVFFNSSGYASDPYIRKIWGAILAAEVKMPGRSSLRTLETVKMLSRDEARMFEGIKDYILNIEDDHNHVKDYFILTDENILKHMGRTFPDILTLVDANLLMPNTNSIIVGNTIKPGNAMEVFAGNRVVFEITNNTEKEMRASKIAMLLTEAGRQIYKILYENSIETDKEEYYKLCKNSFQLIEPDAFIL